MSKISQLGPDGTLIAAGHSSTLKMQLTNEPPQSADFGMVRIWENGKYSSTITKQMAQEILTRRAENGYEDIIKIC